MPLDPAIVIQTTGVHPARRMSFDDLHAGLKNEIAQGFVTERAGPDGLTLYSYTIDCQFDNKWSVFSLISRGLVLDVANKAVVATPFPKFFNYGEVALSLPDEQFTVTGKMDGSLGIAFRYNSKLYCITRGAFGSPQGQWALEHINQLGKEYNSQLGATDLWDLMFPEGYTFLFEIIFPENRIVISYNFAGLVVLACYMPNGDEMPRHLLETWATSAGFRITEQHAFGTVTEMLEQAKEIPHSNEGWVIRYENGFRLKIKGDGYCRLHRLISNVTPNRVWEILVNGDDVNAILRDLPEELKKDFETIVAIYQGKLEALIKEVQAAYDLTKDMNDKECGMYLSQNCPLNSIARTFVFPARKMNFFGEVHLGGTAGRKKAFNVFRPKSNVLAGYTPSSAMNRFASEEA